MQIAPVAPHRQGEVLDPQAAPSLPLAVDTHGRRFHVEWDADAPVTPLGQLVATIESSFPLPQQMDRFFAFETHQFQVSAPEELQRELITTAERQSLIHAPQRAANEASSKIRRDVEAFVADGVASLREQTGTL
ncbi:MAG: hypothetical protein EXS27_05055 [Pedosphaera sp.]|nr:hypothetical protein [Pedosphaera sp.]